METRKSLKEAKWMGGIGGILSLLYGVSKVGFLFWLSGVILSFLAVKKISDLSKRREIFKDYLISFIFSLASFVIFVFILGVVVFFVTGLSMEETKGIIEKIVKEKFVKVIGLVLIWWILMIVSAYFYRKSVRGIAEVTKVNLFNTVGTLTLVGVISSIILIGFLIGLIGQILSVVAFFSLPEELPEN